MKNEENLNLVLEFVELFNVKFSYIEVYETVFEFRYTVNDILHINTFDVLANKFVFQNPKNDLNIEYQGFLRKVKIKRLLLE